MVWERYTSKQTGFQTRVSRGNIFRPMFWCDCGTGMVPTYYATKPPVAKLIMTPTVQFINTNIAWDVSNSEAPNGTVDTFTLKFGGATDIGDQTNIDFTVPANRTGNVQYTTLGTYQATLTVKDTTGAQSFEVSKTIFIVEANVATYLGTSSDGAFRQLPGGAFTQQNTGLTSNALNSLTFNENTSGYPQSAQHVFATNANGIAISTDGASTWTETLKAALPDPANSAGDGTPPVTADLTELALMADPVDPNRLYLLRYTATRIWLFWSGDYGLTWNSVGIQA